jgi:Rrf2 family protein
LFKINRRTDYAVRVGVALARHPADTRLSSQVIQQEMLIPGPFLQRITSELSRANLINTYPGPNGGLQLARPAGEITLKDFVLAMEGPLCLSDCLENPHECPLSTECPVRSRWWRLQRHILQELQQTTLADLAAEAVSVPSPRLKQNNVLFIEQPAVD